MLENIAWAVIGELVSLASSDTLCRYENPACDSIVLWY